MAKQKLQANMFDHCNFVTRHEKLILLGLKPCRHIEDWQWPRAVRKSFLIAQFLVAQVGYPSVQVSQSSVLWDADLVPG